MKKVFTNRELPHIWANQLQSEGRGHNMFFEGDTIYSYGRHFPIAKILQKENIVLYNSERYSNSTNKHQSYTWRAIPSTYTIFNVKGCSSNHKDNIDNWVKDFNNVIEKASLAKKNKEYYLNDAKNSLSTIEFYLEAFKLSKLKFKGLTALLKRKDDILPKELEEKLKKAKLAERKRILEENKQNIRDWIAGDRVSLNWKLDKVYLRTIEDNWELKPNTSGFMTPAIKVETSKGARVNYDNAKLLYTMIKAEKDIKGHKIDGYTVIGLNGVLTIGCHKIERKEIDRFAKSQNW